jgi:hypothetical protein
MEPHAISVSRIRTDLYAMSSEERIAYLEKVEAEYKATHKPNEWSEDSAIPEKACDWPEWIIEIIKSINKRFIWDSMNEEWKVGYPSQEEADKAGLRLRKEIEKFVDLPGNEDEEKWYRSGHLAIRSRQLNEEALEADSELAEQVTLPEAGLIRKIFSFFKRK